MVYSRPYEIEMKENIVYRFFFTDYGSTKLYFSHVLGFADEESLDAFIGECQADHSDGKLTHYEQVK